MSTIVLVAAVTTCIRALATELFWHRALTQQHRSLRHLLRRTSSEETARLMRLLASSHRDVLRARATRHSR